MSELILIIKDISVNNHNLVTWLVAVFMILIGLMSQYSSIKYFFGTKRLEYLLKNISFTSLHNINIPDGIDGKIFIEHLILTPKYILLLCVKKHQGMIFAGEKINLWTQVIGAKSYRFDNPLRLIESEAMLLSSKIKKSQLLGQVLFLKGSEFPKGKPNNVIDIADIKAMKKNCVASSVSEELLEDWKKLTEAAVSNNAVKDNEVLIDKEITFGLNIFYLLSVLTLLFIWLYWRLIMLV